MVSKTKTASLAIIYSNHLYCEHQFGLNEQSLSPILVVGNGLRTGLAGGSCKEEAVSETAAIKGVVMVVCY